MATAPLQGPDEHNHVGYVQHMAETGSGPQREDARGRAPWSTEQRQLMRWENLLGLIGSASARPGWTGAERAQWAQVAGELGPGARKDGSDGNPVGQNPPLYYAYDAVAYRLAGFAELPTRLLVMRLANVPLYLLIVLCAWLAAGELFGRRRHLQTIAAGAVALLPQLAFMSGVVNPDIGLAAVWAALLYVGLVAVRRGPSPRLLAAFGGLAGASALTHGRGLAALGPLLATLVVVAWRARPLTRRTATGVAAALAAMAAATAVAFLYSTAHGGTSSIGDEAGSTAGAGTIQGFAAYLWQFYLPALRTMSPQGPPYGYGQVYVEGLGGTFGSLEIGFPPWVYDVLQLAAGAGLILLVAVVVRRREAIRRHAAQMVVLASAGVSMLALVHAAAYRDLQSPPFDPLIVGRYLLPLVLLFGLAVALVCASLPRRVGAALGAGVLSLFTVLSLSGLGLTLVRFYA